MSPLTWIIVSGLLMITIALFGSVTLILSDKTLEKILLPLVAFAAGTLIGGAFLHMIPTGIAVYGNDDTFCLWDSFGFSGVLSP